MKNNVYNREFYITRDHDTEYSAKKILSIVNDIFQLNSAVDIGCGVGTWLRVFKEMREAGIPPRDRPPGSDCREPP